MESIKIADGDDEKKNRDAIPSILSDALAVSFDNNIGHDYFKDIEARYDFYHEVEDKIPFDLEYFNKITKGGLLIKLSMLLLQALVWVSLCSCVIVPCCFTSKQERTVHHYGDGTRRGLRKESMPISSM